VIEVIIPTIILIIIFIHFLEGSQRIPIAVSWFIIEPIPLFEVPENFRVLVVVVPKICLVIPSVTPIPVSCPEIILIPVIARVSGIVLSPVTIPVCCLWGPYGFSVRTRMLLGWLDRGLVYRLSLLPASGPSTAPVLVVT
jgi:hypothetical protein